MNFHIFPKKSASPTIIIKKNSNPPLVLKLWSESANLPVDKRDTIYGLEYEKNVYTHLVNPLVKVRPSAPFLKYVGEGSSLSYNDVANFLDVNTEEEDRYLSVSILDYLHYPLSANNYDSTRYPSPQEEQTLLTTKFSAIILPYVECNTFFDYVLHGTSKQVFMLLSNIIIGVFHMYKNMKMVHNDLHAENILIEKQTSNTMIFDYDRAYVKGYENRNLSSEQCVGLCRKSQCNIYNEDGFAIDFYKILSYVAIRNDFISIVLSLTKPERHDVIKRSSKTIRKWFFDSSQNFFSTNGCSYLQFPDVPMRYMMGLFGTIEDVYDRIIAIKQSGTLPDFFQEVGTFSFDVLVKRPNHKNMVKNVEKSMQQKKRAKFSKPRFPKPRSIIKIIQENDIRKYGSPLKT